MFQWMLNSNFVNRGLYLLQLLTLFPSELRNIKEKEGFTLIRILWVLTGAGVGVECKSRLHHALCLLMKKKLLPLRPSPSSKGQI